MMTARPVETIQPINRFDTERLARTEYERLASQLRSLAPDEWSSTTDCPLWDVRAVAGHSLGMMATFVGFRRLSRAMGAATKTSKREGGPMIDATILTRDPWMHRIDIAHATGRELELTAEHDGRIVADVVAELARRHGQPFTLTLTGPVGGEFVAGDGSSEHVTIDAIEMCRTLSGRPPAEARPRTGLLATEVPF